MVAIPEGLTDQQRAVIEAAIHNVPPEGIAPGAKPRSWANLEWLLTLAKEEFYNEYHNDVEKAVIQMVKDEIISVEEKLTLDLKELVEGVRQKFHSSPLLNYETVFRPNIEFYIQKFEEIRAEISVPFQFVKDTIQNMPGGPCIAASISLASDIFAAVMSVISIGGKLGKDILKTGLNLTLAKINAISEIIKNSKEATTLGAKVFVATQIFNELQVMAGNMKAYFTDTWNSMSPTDRVLLFVGAAAQIIALVATGGLAIAAEIVGLAVTAYSMKADFANFHTECFQKLSFPTVSLPPVSLPPLSFPKFPWE